MSKLHTTNYYNTFITIAEDCKATEGVAPPLKEPKTAAQIEYDMLISQPYRYTSDDVLYESNGSRRGIGRDDFFSKGQPCFRTSALCKRYGWGIHSDSEGKIAIYAVGTPQYDHLANAEEIKQVKGIRSSRNK
jgi:hypothetical protein